MNPSEFETALHKEGYIEVASRSQAAHHKTQPHAHAFDVRALVIDGEITLTVDGEATRYGVGQVFTMASNREHAESVGANGVTTLSGRRYAA